MAFGGSLAGTARVVLGVDTRDFNRDLTQAEGRFRTSTRRMNDDVGQLSRGVAVGAGAFQGFARSVAFASASFLGAAGFTALVRQSITAASDLDEAINRVRVTFRDSAPEVLEWAEGSAAALGMSREAALGNASSIGAMLIPMGYARQEAAAMSTEMVQLASDMASFNNEDPTEMLDRIRAGLAGETEPLRRFGVDLREASVQAYALRTGLMRKGESLTAAGQLLARYRVLLEQTRDQQGDFARTADGAANAQRTLRASLQDAQAALGRAFLPTVERLLPRLTEWADSLAENEELHERVADAVETTAEVVGDLASAADDVADAVGGWDDAFKLVLAGTLAAGFGRLLGVAGSGAMGAQGARGLAGMAGILSRLRAAGTIFVAIEIATNWDEIKREIREEAGNPNWWKEIFTKGAFSPVGAAVDALRGRGSSGTGAGAVAALGGRTLAIPQSFNATHQTSGLPGFPGVDIFAQAGTPITAPENGTITRTTGGPPELTPAGFKGYSLYFVGNETGNTYYITHLATVAQRGYYRRGDIIGTLAAGTAGGPHAHVGIHRGVAPVAYQPSTSSPPRPTANPGTPPRQPNRSGGGGAVDPDLDLTTARPPRTRPSPLIPFRLQEKLQRAEDTRGLSDDLDVLQEIERLLTRKIQAETNIEKRVALRNERQSVRRQIADITKAKPKRAGEPEDPILQGLYLREARAADTRRLDDDLRALEALDAHLTKKIAAENRASEKTALIRERQGVRGRIADVQERMPIVLPSFTRPPAPLAGFGAAMGGFERLRGGTQAVTLPGLGQILVGNMKASRDMWVQAGDQLKKKLRAAIQRRQTLERSLQRARQIKIRRLRDAAIERVSNNLRVARQQEQDLRDALGSTLTAISEIDETAASEAQRAAEEAEREASVAAREAAADAVRAAEVQARESEMAEAAFQRGLVDLPADIRYAQALAGGTADTADDVVALRRAEGFLAGNLGRGNIETEIQIINSLNGIRDQIRRLTEEQERTTRATMSVEEYQRQQVAFLTGLRSLRSFQANLWDPIGSLSGANLVVQNYFQQGPSDSHIWSREVEFELRALVG